MGGDMDNTNLTVSGCTEFTKYSAEAQSTFATATLKAPVFEIKEQPPVDIVVSLDVSGSMQGTKLDLAKKSIEFVIKNLRSQSRLALVVFDTNVSVKFEITRMDAAGKKRTLDIVQSIRAGSSTNLSGGLLQALNLINNRVDPHTIGSVLLFTDGLANVGIQDTTQIIDAQRSCFNPAGKYSVHTFGFGEDHNATLLKGLSECGNGMYFYVKDVDEIATSFADCLGGLLSTVAQNIEVRLEAINDYAITNLHTNKQFKFAAGNKVVSVSMGDIQSEEEKDILFELALPGLQDMGGITPAINMTISYFCCITNQQLQTNQQMFVTRSNDLADRQTSLHVQRQKFRITTTSAMKEAKLQAEKGNLDAAKLALEQEMAKLTAVDDLYAKELTDDLRQCHSGMVSQAAYRSAGSKFVESCWQSHSEQRSNCGKHSRGYVSYGTRMKGALKQQIEQDTANNDEA